MPKLPPLIATPPPLSRRAAWTAAAVLTLLAGVLRFAWLDRPCLWGDEALVYWRTCGSYADLLVQLKVDGFTPLHYEAVWRIAHGFDVDAWVPWTTPALLAAAAVVGWLACSTVDAKGVRPGLRVTVVVGSVAAIIWHLVGPAVHWVHLGHVRWPGLQLMPRTLRFLPALNGTLLVPAIYFLAAQLLPRRPAVLAAAFAACSGFAAFYGRDAKMYMNCWTPATAGMACVLWWLRTGRATAWLGWVAASVLAAGVHVSALILVAVSALFLMTGRSLRVGTAALWLLGAALIAAGPGGYYGTFNLWVDRVAADGWRDSGLNWVNVYNFGRTGPELARFAGTTFLTGWEWPRAATVADVAQAHPARVYGPLSVTTGLAIALAAGLLPWPRRWQGWGTPAPTDPPPTADPPAPASAAEDPWRVGLWLAAWIVVPLYGFYCRSGGDFASPQVWRSAALDLSAKVDLVGWNPWYWPGWVTFPLVMVAALMAVRAERPRRSPVLLAAAVFFGLLIPFTAAMTGDASAWRPALAVAVSVPLWFAVDRRPTGWRAALVAAWAGAIVGLPLAAYVGLALWFRLDRRPAGRAVVAAAVVAAVWGLCDVVYVVAKPLADAAEAAGRPWRSVWVPRYMGVVWPAVAVGVAALVTRLPTRPVRWVVVVVLLGFNLIVAGHRVFGGTEPPVDRMTADAFAGQGSTTQVTWFDLGDGRGDPGRGNLFSLAGNYYLQQLAGGPMTPAEFKQSRFRYRINRGQAAGGGIARLVARTPTVDRVVVWTEYRPGPTRPPDALAPLLPGAWRLAHEQWFDVVDCWVWQDINRYCRREYARAGRP